MTPKNGKQIGMEHLSTLEEFLTTGSPLPISVRDGSLNLAELSRATGIPKSSFYQNPNLKARLESARKAQGIARQGDRQAPAADQPQETTATQRETPDTTAVLERKLHRMEQQNAALVAENFELRRQLKEMRLQLGREDMTIETGRRIVAPTARSHDHN